MDKYILAEKKLAEMLGVLDKWENAQNNHDGYLKWTRDSDEALKLLVIYNLEINYSKDLVNYDDHKINKHRTKIEIRRYLKKNDIYGSSPLINYEYLDEHGDSFIALRYAIVLAVISILEQNKVKTI